jgi:hypothetical protein
MSAVTTVDFLFDRPLGLRHPWRASFQALTNETHTNLRSSGANLRMDWRVATTAEGNLTEAPEFAVDKLARGLDSALGTYFVGHYCRPAHAVAFVDPTEIRCPSHRKLVHVCTLDGMIRRLYRQDNNRAALSREIRLMFGEPILRSGLSLGEPSDESVDELATRLNQLGPAAVKNLITAIHDLLGNQQPHWWASFHSETRQHLTDGRTIVNVLGLGDLSDGQWLVIYVYTAAEAGLLFRPTVIEANRYAFHFVSPPGFQMGLTMPIDTKLPACAEVIHYPLMPEAAALSCTGQLLRIGIDRAGSDEGDLARYAVLGTLRATQRQRIHKRYSNATARQWLERHQATF